MEERMYGVVLWADDSDSKALIWCEDHGNLAYYSAAEQNIHEGLALGAGDLIQFDVKETPDFRSVRNLKHVNAGFAPDLAHNLQNVCVAQSHASPTTNNVVAFPMERRA